METQKDEIYFACKQAFQTLEGTKLKNKLQEIFTPEIQAKINQQHRIYEAQRPTEEAIIHAQEQAWKANNRP